ncbi:pyruvate kinase [Candidatus Uhrbacteria bacterium RIFCSPHIGHO2_01_FULL_63_20]|uniref:Pyruvate kinase n=1 Tax=Candidatus Uhrbacteria bacterium RIFCSPHIGHO2_01_FULL_63_20 TaxID=1802385 RepID=A0A1F7TMD9_9BACT|nr:MAG: pyruvate kinase [Candidatus Uhrbacteria bacterium RIFCSPHIGHO2_01_FULL_63_20]
MPRTKIVCTIGPASAKSAVLASMMRNGMSVARLNFSHGSHASHRRTIDLVRAAAKKLGEPVAILADLQGPKIRLGELPESGVDLQTGSTVSFSTAISTYRSGGALPVTYKGLHKDVKNGDRILIDDGLLEVRITRVSGTTIHAKMVNGGKVTSHKGMNFPDSTLRVSPITDKDKDDLAFAVKTGVEFVALSFVTDPAQVRALRSMIKKLGGKRVLPRIVVKIEKHEAVRRFVEILAETDVVMVARGDLGVEIPASEVPVRQKEIVAACRAAGKPVIVATQMLDSMIRNPRPTRAEVSDVANAVFDHTDAVMLSGESATGKYPKETVLAMHDILTEAEGSRFDDVAHAAVSDGSVEDQIAHAIASFAQARKIDAVISSVELVPFAERLHKFHPEVPLLLAAPDEVSARQANVRWGVRPFVMNAGSTKTFLARAFRALKRSKKLKKGMTVAAVLGGSHGDGFDLKKVP